MLKLILSRFIKYDNHNEYSNNETKFISSVLDEKEQNGWFGGNMKQQRFQSYE